MLIRLRLVCQLRLSVAQQKALLEIGQRLALLQSVIGGEHRSARYAGDEVDAIEQRGRPVGHGRLIEAGQYAIEKAAARVPPPENDSAMTVSS